MEVVLKTVLEDSQMLSKFVVTSVRKYELQLLEDFLDCDLKKIVKNSKLYIKGNGLDILSVHAPLTKELNNTCINLEDLENDYVSEQLDKVMFLSNEIAVLLNHNIDVVIHNSLRKEDLELKGGSDIETERLIFKEKI